MVDQRRGSFFYSTFRNHLQQGRVSLLTRGNVCQPGSVHRDEEQLESAPRFSENHEFVQPEKKGTSHGRRLISCGGASARGLCFFSAEGEEGRQKRRAEAVLIAVC